MGVGGRHVGWCERGRRRSVVGKRCDDAGERVGGGVPLLFKLLRLVACSLAPYPSRPGEGEQMQLGWDQLQCDSGGCRERAAEVGGASLDWRLVERGAGRLNVTRSGYARW